MKDKSAIVILIFIIGYLSGCKQNSIEVKDLLCENLKNNNGDIWDSKKVRVNQY